MSSMLFGATLAICLPVLAQGSPVALDWHAVSDADVQRCGLAGLRAGTLERLVDQGHAVVERVDEQGVQVQVRSVATGLELQVWRGSSQLRDILHPPQPCDATFVLEAISRIALLVEEVDAPASTAPEPRAEPGTAPAQGLDWVLHASLKSADPRYFLLGGGGLSVLHASAPAVRLGGRLEVSAGGALGVSVVEPSALLVALWQPGSRGLGALLEAGALLSVGHSDRLRTFDGDAQLVAGLHYGWQRLVAELAFTFRPQRIEHRVDGKLALDSQRFGLILRIGAQLSGG